MKVLFQQECHRLGFLFFGAGFCFFSPKLKMSTPSPLHIHYIYKFGLENNRQSKKTTAGFGEIMTNCTKRQQRGGRDEKQMSHLTHGGVAQEKGIA